MTTPNAALRQLEQAEKLHAQHYNQDQDTPPSDAPITENAPAPTEPEAVSTEPKTPAPENSDGHVLPNDESLPEKFERLQQAHKTLQGKYRVEVTRVQEENRQLKEQLAASRSAQASAEREANDAKLELDQVSERMREEIGGDASQAVSDYTSTVVNKEVDSQIGSFKEEHHNQRVSDFWMHVKGQVPNFDSVNNDPEFVKWLSATPDPVTGLTMHDSINQAGEKLNPYPVVEIVKQFEREKSARENASSQLEDYVTPPRKQPTPQVEAPQYTVQDWNTLQGQIRRGEWAGREAEAHALEQKIHAAIFPQ